MKKVAIVLFLILSIFPIYKIHAQTSNAGFVPSNIWYSKDPFEEGDKIKIYTLVFNPDSRELSGTVTFFDVNVFLGKQDFVVPAKGVKTISIDWTVIAGDHTIFGKIENAKFLVSKGKYEEIYLSENETEKSSRSVAKKIIIKAPDPIKNASENGQTSPGTVQNIEALIKEKTPDIIAKPIVLAADAIDGFRENIGTTTENKKGDVNNEIKNFNNSKISSDSKISTSNKILKPLKYIELFFLTIASAIFNNKFLFYGISAIDLFFIIRYIWRLFF